MNEYNKIELRERNSFGVNAVADRLIEVVSVEELRKLFVQGTVILPKWDVLGGGNNVLFVGNYPGTLIKPIMNEIVITSEDELSVMVNVGAGVEWDDFVGWSVERGLWGSENLSLIPGKVGAAPVQNIGAYGVEVKDIIESVEVYRPHLDQVQALTNEECAFGYRDSIFKNSLKGQVVITSVMFRLWKSPKPMLGYGHLEKEVIDLGGPSLENIRRAVIEIRESKLPDTKVNGNAGSFFKNPTVAPNISQSLQIKYPEIPTYPTADGLVKIAAGWLIDKAGWRGYKGDRVGVHPQQALVLINLGGASGEDVMRLSGLIVRDVEDKFGIRIEPEVNILP